MSDSEAGDSDVSFSVELPLDDDGFLRRECPNCDREFKWLTSDESEPPPEAGYCCPYCGRRARADEWFTRGQLRVIEAGIGKHVIDPQLRGLEDSLAGLEDASGGLVSGRLERGAPLRPTRLTEPNDMRRASFECHPNEPVKVLDTWDGEIHCLVCGRAARP
jgi:hypothetical protein